MSASDQTSGVATSRGLRRMGVGVAATAIGIAIAVGGLTDADGLSAPASQPSTVLGTGSGTASVSAHTGKTTTQGGGLFRITRAKPFYLHGVVVGRLYPGLTRDVKVMVSNPNPKPIQVLTVTGRISPTNVSGCPASWFALSSYHWTKGQARTVIPGHSIGDVHLTIRLNDLPTVNQDRCQGLPQLGFTLAGTAQTVKR